MTRDIPIDQCRIIRAAEGMISNHGSNALAESNRRAHCLRSEGLEPFAETWECISQAINHLQVTDPKMKGVHSRSREKSFSFEEYCD